MTATQRIRSMLDGSPVKEIGACGWLHTIGADRDTAEVFSSAIIKMTDYSKWDFIKVMPNGVYNQEAQYRQLIYGVLLVLLMMVKPQGLLGDINFKYIRQRMEHREKSKEAANE